MSQLSLFQPETAMPAPLPTPAHSIAAPRHASGTYRPFDETEARRIILERCTEAGGEWVSSRALSKAHRMSPLEASGTAHRLVVDGKLEETYLYYGSAKPGPGYMGFQYGYRIAAQQVHA